MFGTVYTPSVASSTDRPGVYITNPPTNRTKGSYPFGSFESYRTAACSLRDVALNELLLHPNIATSSIASIAAVIDRKYHSSIEAEMDQDYGEVESVSPTIATLADRAVVDEADMDIPAAVEAAEARSTEPTPLPTVRKRGRPSLSTSATPVGSVSSKTGKIAGHSTSKRKSVAEVEPKGNQPAINATLVRKRSRPASDRTKPTAVSAPPAVMRLVLHFAALL